MNAYVTQTKDFDSSENVPAVKAHFGFSFTPTRTRDPGLTQYGITHLHPAFNRSLSYFDYWNQLYACSCLMVIIFVLFNTLL